MTNGKVSACLYISREVLEAAKEAGLNISRVAENALIEAIGRLDGRVASSGECGGRDLHPPPSGDITRNSLFLC